MTEKKSFLLYIDYQRHIQKLSDEEAGKLFKALFQYAESGENTALPPQADMAFSFISACMDRDFEKWEEIKKKRSEAVKKRWEKEKRTDTNVYKSIQTDTNDTVNVNVNVNGNVNDNVNDNVNVNGNVNDNEIYTGADSSAPKSPKTVRHKFGEYHHVLLTDDQYENLTADYGEATADQYIRKVDEYAEVSGKRYKNYYLAVRNFISRDGIRKKSEEECHEQCYGEVI